VAKSHVMTMANIMPDYAKRRTPNAKNKTFSKNLLRSAFNAQHPAH